MTFDQWWNEALGEHLLHGKERALLAWNAALSEAEEICRAEVEICEAKIEAQGDYRYNRDRADCAEELAGLIAERIHD